jgi:hypothetical protein
MGTSCVTISHRPAMVAFHDIVLALDGEGGWSVHNKKEGFSRSSSTASLTGGGGTSASPKFVGLIGGDLAEGGGVLSERKADAKNNLKAFAFKKLEEEVMHVGRFHGFFCALSCEREVNIVSTW